jgi:asparagine N-glycosylation enzyme membrane subunit Stt3
MAIWRTTLQITTEISRLPIFRNATSGLVQRIAQKDRAMSSTVLSRLIVMMTVAVFTAWPGAALAGKAATGTTLVAQIYKDFAWQAISGESATFGPSLESQSKAVLEKYFDPTLTSLLLKDAKCRADTHEVCNLDSDIIFSSADPAAIDLRVQASGPAQVFVVFTYPSSQEKLRIEFKLARVAGNWKITDIVYASSGGPSLKEILLHELPGR